jgi:thiol-disulfide isomerase/thioredoxin
MASNPGRPDDRASNQTRRQQQQAQARAAAQRRRRQRSLWLRGGIAAAVAAVVAAAAIGLAHGSGSSGGSGGAGSTAPTSTDPAVFALPRLNGNGQVRLADFHGKPTVVNFFASWCTACRGELPGFAKISRELKGEVQFVGVNSLENGDGMSMARDFGIDWWPLARDVDGQQDSGLHDALGGQGMPITAFYDAQGKLLYVNPGALPEDALRARLQALYRNGA